MTLNETISLYEQTSLITENPRFFLPVIGFALLFIIVYLIWGSLAKASAGGRETKVISTANFWISFFLIFFFLILFVLFLIFPIWLSIF